MKSEENITDFFKKRLSDLPVEAESWNTPSDEIWNKAKVHFPKKKNNRKLFLKLFFGLSVLLFTTVGIFISKQSNSSTLSTNPIATSNTQSLKNTEKENTEITNSASTSLATNLENTINTTNTSTSNTEIETNNTEAKNIATVTTTPTRKNIKGESIATASDFQQAQNSKASTSAESADVNLKNSNPATSNYATFDETINQSSAVVTTSTSSLPILNAATNTNKPGITKSEGKQKIELEAIKIPLLPNQIERLAINPVETINKPAYAISKPLQKRSRWEIGLSHAQFMVFPREIFEVDSIEGDENIDISLSYRNINIPVNYRINSRFGISSGVYFSTLNSNISFTDTEIYDIDNSDRNLEAILRNRAGGGTISLESETQDFDIMFKPGVNLLAGDNLIVQGELPLNLRLVQVPIFFNYHFGKGKFEWFLHAGFSIDFYKVSVETIDFAIFKNNQLISEPIVWEPLSESAIGPNIYTGIGVKYHLNEHLNIGLNSLLDPIFPTFSRYEIGIYYGL